MKSNLLRFSAGNSKIKNIPSFSLPSGYSCPFALNCLSKANKTTGKITDGKHTEFRCFSASTEALFKEVRAQRWHNFEMLRKCKTEQAMVNLINISLPFNNRYIRLHVGGDFFSPTYFNAWIQVAKMNPDIVFYAYTKAIPYWITALDRIPENLRLTASYGGTHDLLIEKFNLKFARVVYSEQQAENLGLEIDHDDSNAYKGDKSFALLIHGTQPAKSEASRAKELLAKNGWTGYNNR